MTCQVYPVVSFTGKGSVVQLRVPPSCPHPLTSTIEGDNLLDWDLSGWDPNNLSEAMAIENAQAHGSSPAGGTIVKNNVRGMHSLTHTHTRTRTLSLFSLLSSLFSLSLSLSLSLFYLPLFAPLLDDCDLCLSYFRVVRTNGNVHGRRQYTRRVNATLSCTS